MQYIIKSIVPLLFLLFPFTLFAQSTYLPQGTKHQAFLNRLEILLQRNDDLNLATAKPLSRKIAVRVAEQADSLQKATGNLLSKVDEYNLRSLLMNNSEWVTGSDTSDFYSKKSLWNTFYKTKANGLEQDGYNIAGIADNAEEAQQLFNDNEVDIILMDVNIIGEKDGIDTATEILKQKAVPIIYLTAFTDAATINRIKQTHPAAFLSKPYSLTNVRIAIELAVNNFAVSHEQQPTGKIISLDKDSNRNTTSPEREMILRMNDHIFVKSNYAFVKLKLSDLLYIEADNNYTSIITPEKKFLIRLSLNQLLDKINYKALVRIHRSYAVNINAIHSFNEQEVEINQQHLPIGRNYKEEFLKHFDFR